MNEERLFKAEPRLQFAEAGEIKRWQDAALRRNLEYMRDNSPFYRELFAKNKIDISKITATEGLRDLPTVGKEEIQRRNEDFFAARRESLIDYTTTSGTLGLPVVVPLTENDLQRLAYNEKQSFATAGLGPGDVLQLMLTLDKRFMAGMAYYLGARESSMGVIRVGSGLPGLQWDSISLLKPTACMAVPTFLIKLIEYAAEQGINYRESSIGTALCIGEVLRNPDLSPSAISLKLNSLWPELRLRSTYASTEMQSSFTECASEQGGHIPPDLIICEILDDEGREVKDGDPGELCITTLGVEGFPLLRFRTGDICRKLTGPCPCGRNAGRLSPLLGRKSHMIKYKGTTMYPPALFDLLDSVPGVNAYIIEVSTSENGTDDIRLKLDADPTDEALKGRIRDACRLRLRAVPTLEFCSRAEIDRLRYPENSRKMVKFIDLRKKV